VTELVQTFRFAVRLTRASTPGPTGKPPPSPQALPGNLGPGPGTSRGRDRTPDQLGDGGFQECGGLELSADIHDYLEGGRNDGIIRRVGRVKLVPVVLKRGMLMATPGGYADIALWDWLHGMVRGGQPVPRYNGQVEVFDPAMRRVVARWSFYRGLPLKVTGPVLNAKTGEIAIEELQIAHEGLRLEATP